MLSSLTRATVAILVVAGSLAGCGSSSSPSGTPSNPAPTPSSNPAPTLSSVSPMTASPGGTGFVLTATGTNFVATSVLHWNGTPRTTTFVSASQLTAQIPSVDIASGGTAVITVVTPAPGGGTSAPATLTITAVNASVDQVASGGMSSSSAHYRIVATVGPPASSTAAKSEHYQLQGGLTGSGLNIP